MVGSIKEVMEKEHAKISELLEKLEVDAATNSADVKKDFNELRNCMKQHFYIEDEAIFSIFTTMKEREVPAIFDLMQEHGIILSHLSDIERKINSNQPLDLEKLKGVFIEHQRVEERFFYTILEKELNENQKAFIVNKVGRLSEKK